MQLIIGLFFVSDDHFRVIVVADHWRVVCCSWLLAYCLLQLIDGVVFDAAD